jgi:hypothetical protein
MPGTLNVRRILAVRHYAIFAPRKKLLKKIYAPLAQIDSKSPEYLRLALTGKCWHHYFDPGNMERYGYMALEKVG